MLKYVVILEIAIVAASGLDARLRPESDGPLRRSWLIRWFYWHLAPLWAAWIGLVHLLGVATRACARRTVERWRYEQAQALMLDRLFS